MTSTDTSTEIEDVLASIRRLVSQDAEPIKSGASLPTDDEGYLVLTPEQRISMRVAEAVAARDTSPADPENLTDELTRLESTIAELEAVVSAAREQAVEDDVTAEAPFVDLSEIEETGAEVTYLHGANTTNAANQPGDTAEEFSSEEEEEEEEISENPPEQEDEAALRDELSETGDEDFLHEDVTVPVAARARTIVRGGSIADEDFDADLDDDIADTVGIDEDVLREMVAQMIRDELRGVLGERITSNVRKLVRREIQRAFRDQLPD